MNSLFKETRLLFWPCVAFLLLAGCAHENVDQNGSYDAIPARHASSSALSGYTATVTAPDGGMATMTSSPESNDLRQKVYTTLMSNPSLVPYPSKVVATISAGSKDTIVLTGTVPSNEVKEKLLDAIRHVEGVANVRDSLTVRLPRSSREFKAPEVSVQ
jgi:hypothetical protein